MRNILCCLFFVLSIVVLEAQNATSSPFSRVGYGEVVDNSPTSYRGMGGVTIGMRSSKAINPMQPASYTAGDSVTFMFDLAADLMWSQYGDTGGKKNKWNGNLDYITMQFPIWRRYLAFSLGVMPFTQSGYSYTHSDSVGSDVRYHNTFYGEGGITDLYVGLGGNIKDWVAVGVNMYYMFGDVSRIHTLTFDEATINPVVNVSEYDVKGLRFRYGVQIFHTFERGNGFVVGGIFENKRQMNTSYSIHETSLNDTIAFTPASDKAFESPLMYGVGATYTYGKRLTISADYLHQQWSRARFEGGVGELKNRNKMALGVEYRHNPMGRNYAERMFWRMGGNISNQYDPSVDTKDFNVSLGLGFPLRTSATIFNFSVDYGHRGDKNTIEEHFVRLTFNASINEHWFFKRKL